MLLLDLSSPHHADHLVLSMYGHPSKSRLEVKPLRSPYGHHTVQLDGPHPSSARPSVCKNPTHNLELGSPYCACNLISSTCGYPSKSQKKRFSNARETAESQDGSPQARHSCKNVGRAKIPIFLIPGQECSTVTRTRCSRTVHALFTHGPCVCCARLY